MTPPPETPPPNVDPFLWFAVQKLREESDLREQTCGRIVQQLDGVNAKDIGRVGRLEQVVKEHTETLKSLDRLTWKIVTAASLAGVTTSVLVAVFKWAIAKG